MLLKLCCEIKYTSFHYCIMPIKFTTIVNFHYGYVYQILQWVSKYPCTNLYRGIKLSISVKIYTLCLWILDFVVSHKRLRMYLCVHFVAFYFNTSRPRPKYFEYRIYCAIYKGLFFGWGVICWLIYWLEMCNRLQIISGCYF